MARGTRRPPPWALMVIAMATAFLLTGLVVAEQRDRTGDPTPAQAAAVLDHVEPTEAAGDGVVPLPRPADRPLRVLFVGDSIARGSYASTREQTFPEIVASELEEGGPVEHVVPDSTAQTTTHVLDEGAVQDIAADLIIVELGTADVDKSTLAQFGRDYPALLDDLLATSPDATLVCAGPWGRVDKTRPFDLAVQDACEERGGTFVPLSGLYSSPPLHATVGQPSLQGPAADDFHPNDRGHARIAESLLAPLGLAN